MYDQTKAVYLARNCENDNEGYIILSQEHNFYHGHNAEKAQPQIDEDGG